MELRYDRDVPPNRFWRIVDFILRRFRVLDKKISDYGDVWKRRQIADEKYMRRLLDGQIESRVERYKVCRCGQMPWHPPTLHKIPGKAK